MVRYLNLGLALMLAWGLAACSSGSSSGGGAAADTTTAGTTTGTTGTTGTTTGTTSAGDTVPVVTTTTSTFTESDLTGTWNYTLTQQSGTKSCSGSMTFSGTRLTGYTNSCCPSGQLIITPLFWVFSDGYVKGRNYAWCTDTQEYEKFSMNFDKNGSKNRITGLMDLHLDPMYARFNITMTR